MQVLINKFSCAKEVYKIAIKRWRIARTKPELTPRPCELLFDRAPNSPDPRTLFRDLRVSASYMYKSAIYSSRLPGGIRKAGDCSKWPGANSAYEKSLTR